MNLRPLVCSACALLALGTATSGEEASSFVLPASEQINKAGELMRTPLMQAVRRGNADEVRALLAAGANPNIPEWHDNTPLMHACQHGYTDIVRMLLAAGADVNARNAYGQPPLHLAAYYGYESIVDKLRAIGTDIRVEEEPDESETLQAHIG